MSEVSATALRLLLVEDNSPQRCALQHALHQRHHELYVCEACSVDEACRELACHTFDVVLTSHHLHDGDAETILQLTNTMPHHRPAVVVIGDENELGMDEEYISHGAQAFLIREEIKPCSLVSTLLQARQHAVLQEAMREQINTLQDLAEHDALTGLYNRHMFDDHLRTCLARGERHNTPFALVMIDLDEFKRVNDHWGHCTGDAVLREAASRIAALCRHSDFACRIGGDEFAVLLPDINDERDATILAERLAEALDEPLHAGDGNFYIKASIGIALYPHHGRSAVELMTLADQAMYHCKRRKHEPGHCAAHIPQP